VAESSKQGYGSKMTGLPMMMMMMMMLLLTTPFWQKAAVLSQLRGKEVCISQTCFTDALHSKKKML
jgi:hypothetical protein